MAVCLAVISLLRPLETVDTLELIADTFELKALYTPVMAVCLSVIS